MPCRRRWTCKGLQTFVQTWRSDGQILRWISKSRYSFFISMYIVILNLDLIWFIRISFTFQLLRCLYFFVHWFICIKLICENCGENSCFVTICFDDIVKYGKKQYCQFYKVRIAFSFQFYVILLFTYCA